MLCNGKIPFHCCTFSFCLFVKVIKLAYAFFIYICITKALKLCSSKLNFHLLKIVSVELWNKPISAIIKVYNLHFGYIGCELIWFIFTVYLLFFFLFIWNNLFIVLVMWDSEENFVWRKIWLEAIWIDSF